MSCYITKTGSFLPGDPVSNDEIETYLGSLRGESVIKDKVLAANKITQRHYAQDSEQNPTHDVYGLAALAVENCLPEIDDRRDITYLSAGSTSPPLIGPGLASVLHGQLAEKGILTSPVEINSNSGICTSAAQSIVNAYRAIEFDRHTRALCVASEHPSEVLKSSFIKPEFDAEQVRADVRKSKWFMSVFLRFMLSDGAGAFLLSDSPNESGVSYRINWTYSESFAHEAPLCMKLERESMALTQDVEVLAEHLSPSIQKVVANAMSYHGESLSTYDAILPHLSSYYFIRALRSVLREHLESPSAMEYWTNLSTTGNTGAASIFVMLDEYTRDGHASSGDRVMLFIPESGQFNFVLVSLTVV